MPSLYGITAETSNRFGENLWGKNQFNTAFPLALCLYMRDHHHSPVSVIASEDSILADDEVWSMAEVVGDAEDELYFSFEDSFKPYGNLSRNVVDKIDLVVSVNGVQKIPLEIKLTVIPDNSTVDDDEAHWAPEIVMRPVSSAHAMMRVATRMNLSRFQNQKEQAIDSLRKAYNKISDWSNATEIMQNASLIYDALSKTLKITEILQQPFLVQPTWRTKGQSLNFCDQCFDVFVWSDVAVLRIPVDQFSKEHSRTPQMNQSPRVSSLPSALRVSRPLREMARHVRALYDLLVAGDYDYNGIYGAMGLGTQTDKSFSVSGRSSLKFLRHRRLATPLFSHEILHDLILDKGELELKPERRFDAAVLSHMSD